MTNDQSGTQRNLSVCVSHAPSKQCQTAEGHVEHCSIPERLAVLLLSSLLDAQISRHVSLAWMMVRSVWLCSHTRPS